ncbi:MAG: phosphatidylglycerol lysyltransferase domain-containing protein [Candidatus Omnitrophota bacterium]
MTLNNADMMKLNKLTLKDKKIFDAFLSQRPHELSCYCFQNIYIWSRLYDIFWVKIQGALCVFFKDNIGCFMYLEPLGENITPEITAEAFEIMDSFNENSEISRIENIEDKQFYFYQDLGLKLAPKPGEYLCKREDLAQLKGNAFKSKRASYNYFVKHYKYEYLPYGRQQKQDCLKLYRRWVKERKANNQDKMYQGMLEDGRTCLEIILSNCTKLGFIGRVVRVKKDIIAFTFGFKLNEEAFCISHEVAQLKYKGIAQFIFREFCREVKDYKYINIMDDSGLENLKKVKLSYRPLRTIAAYVGTRTK